MNMPIDSNQSKFGIPPLSGSPMMGLVIVNSVRFRSAVRLESLTYIVDLPPLICREC